MSSSDNMEQGITGKDAEKQQENDKSSGKCCLRTRTRLEQFLLLLVIILLILLIVFIALQIRHKDDDLKNNGACVTQGCVSAAADLSRALDFSVDPCNDFYMFACGGWKRSHVIPESRTYIASFSLLREEVAITLKYLLEGEITDEEPESVANAKRLYASCSNTSYIEERNLSVAIKLLDSFGGWPILGNKPGGSWDSSKFNLHKLLADLMLYYNNPIIGFYVSINSKNTSSRILYMDQPGLNMNNRIYYISGRDDPRLKAYITLVKNIIREFGPDENTLEQDVEDMIKLEIALANMTIPGSERRDSEALYNLYTVGNLSTLFPEPTKFEFKWMSYINEVFGMEGLEMTIEEDEPIVVEEPRYFRKLFPLLEQFSNRTIANMIIWSIMMNRIKNLPERFENFMTEFNKEVTGRKAATPRWKKCTTYVNGQLDLAVGRLYVKEKFDEMAKEDTNLMIDGIQGAYRELIEELDWMDEATRKAAVEKAEYMQRKIGYNDFLLDDDWLDEMYVNHTMSRDLYFENVLHLLHLWVVTDFGRLRLGVDKKAWTSTPARVNAYYSATYNRIIFPAGILQPPYYQRSQPKSLNYGGIGSLIGHEITHGFDDNGRQHDKFGNLYQWWSDTAIEKFDNKTKCFIDQYNNFQMPDAGNMNLDGWQTLGENIADNGGLKQAFRAYRNWVKGRGQEEPMLPGVNLTHNQLFFVNFAQIRCTNHRFTDAVNQIMNGAHSPSRFRVIGTLQNMEEFAETYQCPVGSRMNPEHKCRLW